MGRLNYSEALITPQKNPKTILRILGAKNQDLATSFFIVTKTRRPCQKEHEKSAKKARKGGSAERPSLSKIGVTREEKGHIRVRPSKEGKRGSATVSPEGYQQALRNF